MTQPALCAQAEAVMAELERTAPESLIRHVKRVVVEVRELCPFWDVDPDRAVLAAAGHDLFRATAPAQLLELARRRGLPITEADEAGPVLLHGPLAALELQSRFAVTDDEVIVAVRDHTVGTRVPPILAKVLLLADKFERNKRQRTPIMKDIRRLSRRDLDLALLCWADWKWVEERTREQVGHPDHWAARSAWVAHHHAEAGLPLRTSAGDESHPEMEEHQTETPLGDLE